MGEHRKPQWSRNMVLLHAVVHPWEAQPHGRCRVTLCQMIFFWFKKPIMLDVGIGTQITTPTGHETSCHCMPWGVHPHPSGAMIWVRHGHSDIIEWVPPQCSNPIVGQQWYGKTFFPQLGHATFCQYMHWAGKTESTKRGKTLAYAHACM